MHGDLLFFLFGGLYSWCRAIVQVQRCITWSNACAFGSTVQFPLGHGGGGASDSSDGRLLAPNPLGGRVVHIWYTVACCILEHLEH